MNQWTPVKPAAPTSAPRPGPRREAAYRAAERMSELIGSIYDCALDPGKWDATLASISGELAFASSALGILALRSGPHVVNAHVGFDPEWLALRDSHKAATVELWGGARQMEGFPLDEPIICSQTSGFATRAGNRYFTEVLGPRGMMDAVVLTIARGPSLFGYVCFNRHESHGELGEIEVEALRILGPHFRRAVTISDLFDMRAIEVATFGAVLDSFAFGIVLVDEHLGIVHANQNAHALLAARHPVRSERGALVVTERIAHAALERAVRDAAGDQAHLGEKGIGLPVRSADGGSFVIHVLPISRGEMRRGLGQRASVALFVAPAAASRRTPTEALTLLYDLTPAEARVLEMLAAGSTQAAIGRTLGIAKSTVKSHVLHLFDKTGCRRQVELVRLASNLSLPI